MRTRETDNYSKTSHTCSPTPPLLPLASGGRSWPRPVVCRGRDDTNRCLRAVSSERTACESEAQVVERLKAASALAAVVIRTATPPARRISNL